MKRFISSLLPFLFLQLPLSLGVKVVAQNSVPVPIRIPGVENAFRINERIYSGSQPETDAAFETLAKLGIKTVLSVDGSKPDIDRARRYGLRYIHLPFGYEGIPTNRVAELARVTTLATGPFYVHCHHGLHRGPAAVAVICEATEGWSPTQALAWLSEAGTSKDYPGLYRAAREFKSPLPAQLSQIKELPELTRPTSLVDTMVSLDEHLSWLKRSQKAGWLSPPGHPDISPAHEAGILWELVRELPRSSDLSKEGQDFQQKLAESEKTASAFHSLFSAGARTNELDAAFARASQSCANCHRVYRNGRP